MKIIDLLRNLLCLIITRNPFKYDSALHCLQTLHIVCAPCCRSQWKVPITTSSLGVGWGGAQLLETPNILLKACLQQQNSHQSSWPAGACKHLNYDLFSGLWFVPGTLAGTKVKPVVHPITTSSPYRHTWSYVPNFVDYHSPTSR